MRREFLANRYPKGEFYSAASMDEIEQIETTYRVPVPIDLKQALRAYKTI